MPDPTLPPLPPGFTLDEPQAAPGGSMVVGTPRPPKPEFIPGSPGQVYDPATGGAKDIPGFRPKSEATQAPSGYRFTAEGNLEAIPGGPADKKVDPELAQSIKGLGLEEWLNNVATARQLIKDGWATGIIGKLGGIVPGSDRNDFLGTLQGIQGATILEKLQALREQSKNGSSGMGSLTEQEGERLANSIAALNPDMSGDQLLKNLDVVERHARSLQAIGAGENPDDPAVQKKYGIAPIASAPPADVNPIANNTPGDQGPQLTPSNDGYRTVIDPKKQALGEKIAALVSKGADRNTVMGFAVGADPTLRNDPRFAGWVDQALKYRKQHPKAQFPIDPGFYTTRVPLSQSEQLHNDAAQSAPVAAGTNAVDAFSAGNLANIAGALGGDAGKVEQALAVQGQQHPLASLAGSLGGAAASGMLGEGLLAQAGIGSGLGRSVLSDALYGGTAGATNSDDPVTGAIKGGLAGAGGSLTGNYLGRGLGAALQGVTNPAVGYVARELPGDLTIGQAVGKSGVVGRTIKGLEDRVAGFSGPGDVIKARHLESYQKMNARAFDKALEPIGENGGGQFGSQAVADAQDKVAAAFQRALAGKAAGIDTQFIVQAAKAKNAIADLPDTVRGEVNNQVDHVVNSYFDDNGQITGENMQALLRELGGIKSAYQGHPLGHRIGKIIDELQDGVEGTFRRQAPEVMPQYDAAKLAFKRLSTLERAVLSADGTGGVFTPAQLGRADRGNTVKYGGQHAAAAGKGQFHEFARNMQEVLPNKVPDSGTSGRLALLTIPGAVAGSGAGIGYALGDPQTGAATGLGLAGLLALGYSKFGQKALTAAVLKRGNGAKAAGRAVRKSAPMLGHGTAGETALGVSRE